MGREGKSADYAVTMRKQLFAVSFAAILVLILVDSGCGIRGFGGDGLRSADGPEVTEEGVRFSVFSTKVKQVTIAGEFNNWSMTADPLYDREGTGMWTILLPLPPGRYEYKFVIDGEKWIPDPGNQDAVDDGFGGVNSVVIVE